MGGGTMREAVIPCLGLMLVLLFGLRFSDAREYLVGGRENSWKIPSNPDALVYWASKMRFLIGDSLEIKYDPNADSVLQVTEENYKSCNKMNPIKAYNDGDTKIALDHSGQFYFISGADGHCDKGEKMVVRVLSAKHGTHLAPSTSLQPAMIPPASAPAPSHLGFLAPAPAPSGVGGRVKGGALGVALVLVSLVLLG